MFVHKQQTMLDRALVFFSLPEFSAFSSTEFWYLILSLFHYFIYTPATFNITKLACKDFPWKNSSLSEIAQAGKYWLVTVIL